MIIDPCNSFLNCIKLDGILHIKLELFFKKKYNLSEFKMIVIELE
jgi:hypothetical protein